MSSNDESSKDKQRKDDPNPFGDDQGTRVGRPDTPDRDNTGIDDGAARGILDANHGGNQGRPGSEPLEHREQEHTPAYGGKGGKPRTPPE